MSETRGGNKTLCIDLKRCQGHARCLQEAPEVFGYGDTSNQAYVLPGANLEANREAIDMAIETCPERAISWTTDADCTGNIPHAAPAITDDSREFWTAGERSELRIYRCDDCGTYIHPPVPVCRNCRSLHVGPQTVSGRGTLVSYTVNHQQWSEQFDGPYVVGLVQIDEQAGVHLTTNIVGCPLAEIRIGMPVAVAFHQHGDAWLPLFRPVR